MTAAWTTCFARRFPAPVAIAWPTAIGACATASCSISDPPARLIAPATPAPIQSSLFAAFAIASTSSSVMSPSTTSRFMRGTLTAAGAWHRVGAAKRRRLHAEDRCHVRRQPPVPAPEQLHRARHQECAHNRDVDEDGRRESETELLEADDGAGDEAHERR